MDFDALALLWLVGSFHRTACW